MALVSRRAEASAQALCPHANSGQPCHNPHASSTVNGCVLYTPRIPAERRQHATPTLPTPHVRPRQSRPHTIHIVSYPTGYVPTELRPVLGLASPDARYAAPTKPALPKPTRRPIFQCARNTTHKKCSKCRQPRQPRAAAHDHPSPLFSASPPCSSSTCSPAFSPSPSANSRQPNCFASTKARVLAKLRPPLSASAAHPTIAVSPPTSPSSAVPAAAPVADPSLLAPPLTPVKRRRAANVSKQSRPNSLLSIGQRLSLTQAPSHDDIVGAAPTSDAMMPSQPGLRSLPMMADVLSQHPHSTSPRRNSFRSARSVKNIMTSSVSEVVRKPIASGGGMSIDIVYAEPHVFLAGFDHDSQVRRINQGTSAMLRGTLRLVVTKNVKVRGVSVKLQGKARTDWPEGLPPLKVEVCEEEILRSQHLTFFNAMHGTWETPYGNMCTYNLKKDTEDTLASVLSKFAHGGSNALFSDTSSLASAMSSRETKRLSLQQVQARSFGKDDSSSPMVQSTQAKGYKVFYPGTYEYTFEFPIDHHQLETIRLPFGSVKWELAGEVERAGAFKPNLHGNREVSIVRVPDQLSLETVEPISISRQWEDQLYYDIVISGKAFPIGGKIPIAFKLMPLAKVQIHKLKVYITESIEYWTSNRRVTRREPVRKILLFEKVAGKPVDQQYHTSSINFTMGGELSPDQRNEARAIAAHRREMDALRSHTDPVPLPDASDNLLGDLDLGLETFWGSTELEMNVQIPTCRQMQHMIQMRLHPDCSWRNAVVHHWIKVVMRVSRVDASDPGGRRRHFEISIDSPLTILNCLATQTNTLLPRYSDNDLRASQKVVASCGCYDACTSTPSTSPSTPVDHPSSYCDMPYQSLPAPPQAAHLHAHSTSSSSDDTSDGPLSSDNNQPPPPVHRTAHAENGVFESPRPIHLLRMPSYAPPAFEEDESPPHPADLVTPPPNYDAIVTPSVDGLADYFSRLANYNDSHNLTNNVRAHIDDESDSDSDVPTRIASRGGRVNVANPRTLGMSRAPSRSMDVQRPVVPFHIPVTPSSHLGRRAE